MRTQNVIASCSCHKRKSLLWLVRIVISCHGLACCFFPTAQAFSSSAILYDHKIHEYSLLALRRHASTLNLLIQFRSSSSGEDSGMSNTQIDGHESRPVRSSASTWLDINQIGELKRSIDIISVIESYNLEKFERKGVDRATAICPFHDDHNPSLSIDRTRQMYKCFSCGIGGDVFHFVREFSRQKMGEEMTFYQSLRFVSSKFGSGSFGADDVFNTQASSYQSEGERQERLAKKERMLLANKAASAFYAHCLKQPFGGGARSHLRSRGLDATTAAAHTLGYAPDCYFGQHRSQHRRGEGSLVECLRSLDFSPTEIVDSGLAVRVRQQEQPAMLDQISYDDIMDRFRHRLMVPIFDRSGNNVVGFGGRILPATDFIADRKDGFQAPKYLNSPETFVFEKKRVLYGHHLAENDLRGKRTDENGFHRPLLLVEGYMDAIALSSVGIRNVVSCMGTGLSTEHLAAAAQIAGVGTGKIVICLDNDDAGVEAVERLCSNGMLSDTATKYGIHIDVASLPFGCKDPAEFVEQRRSDTERRDCIADDFKVVVLSRTKDWVEWYIQRTIDHYDASAPSGSSRSFACVFERIATFLAKFLGPADRVRRSIDISRLLAGAISGDLDSPPSEAVRVQLEADLIDMSSRIANSRESLRRRSELEVNVASEVAFSMGYGPTSLPDVTEKLSTYHKDSQTSLSDESLSALEKRSLVQLTSKRKEERRRAFRRKSARLSPKTLTPHFSGFYFVNKSDAAWLGLTGRKDRMHELTFGSWSLAQKPFSLGTSRDDDAPMIRRPVYFNSLNYNGDKFVTEEAIAAGYDPKVCDIDASVVDKGIASLLVQDSTMMLQTVEDQLLRSMIQHGPTRVAIRDLYRARLVVNSRIDIKWSTPEKQWLFGFLISKMDSLSHDDQQPERLKEVLSSQQDCPTSAFDVRDSLQHEGEIPNGLLEKYFRRLTEEESDMVVLTGKPSISIPFAQECFANLIWASTADHARSLRQELLAVSKMPELDGLTMLQLPATLTDDNAQSDANAEHIDENCLKMIGKLADTNRDLLTMGEASKLILSRLLDSNGSSQSEGRLSASLREQLAAELDEYTASVTEVGSPGHDAPEREAYEDALERMQEEWGEWYDDDYTWTPDQSKRAEEKARIAAKFQNHLDDDTDEGVEHEESIEEALARIEREWGAWDS